MGTEGWLLLFAGVVLVLGTAVSLLVPDWVSARPILQPCSYNNTCIATTVRRTFESEGQLSGDGHRVTVRAHIPCEGSDRFFIEVRVTQGDVTAIGDRGGPCDRDDVWPVTATLTEGQQLGTGAAQACGTAETFRGEKLTSGQSWCRTITLVAD